MGKVSSANKMRIQTLREQGYGVKAVMATYHRTAGSSVWWRKFVSALIKQPQRLNARLAVVGRNLHARTQTSHVLRNSFVPKKDRAASTWAPMRLPLNSISVTDQSIVLWRKISIVGIILLYIMFFSDVFEWAKIARWHCCNANNFQTVFDY